MANQFFNILLAYITRKISDTKGSTFTTHSRSWENKIQTSDNSNNLKTRETENERIKIRGTSSPHFKKSYKLTKNKI